MEWMDRSGKESSGTMYDKPTSVIEPGDLLGTIRGLQDPLYSFKSRIFTD